ncbi:MAG: hypothetical protein WD557_16060 [Dehalococcoidia bacterium]
MKIQLLGNSDTSGAFFDGKTWAGHVRDGMSVTLSREVKWREVGFSALGPTAPAFAEKKVREWDPDIVILPVGTFPFSVTFVWKRVEQLFGKRAGRWYRNMENRFDNSTRARGSLPNRANSAGRSLVRRLVGTAPLATVEETAAAYGRTARALARIEDTQVILLAYGMRGQHNFAPGGPERRARFMALMADVARDHHLRLIDGQEAFTGIPREVPTTTPDGFHNNAYGHELLGAYILAQLLRTTAAPA